MKTLVTGARGFVGQWVVRQLSDNGFEPEVFTGDIRNVETFPKRRSFDAIIHLAALITHRGDYGMDDLIAVNVMGTKHLLDSYPQAKMVYVSTTDVTRETLSNYAKTKYDAEEIVRGNKNSVIVRLTSVFGPGQRQRKLIPSLFEKYCADGTCTIHNNDMREYLYVEDAAKEIVSAIPKSGIVTPKGYKIRNFDLDRLIRSACKAKDVPGMAPDQEYFFSCLLECVPWYREIPI